MADPAPPAAEPVAPSPSPEAAPASGAAVSGERQDKHKSLEELQGSDDLTLFIRGLHKPISRKVLIKFLQANAVPFRSARKTVGQAFGFATFHTAADRDRGAEIIGALEYRGQQLSTSIANAKRAPAGALADAPAGRKRPRDSDRGDGSEGADGAAGDGEPGKAPAADRAARSPEEEEEEAATADAPAVRALLRVLRAVTPWWRVPYADQASRKDASMRQTLVQVARRVRKDLVKGLKAKKRQRGPVSRHAPTHIPRYLLKWRGMACPALPLAPAPQHRAYRNKVSLTCGRDHTGEPLVGFRAGSFAGGSRMVVAPHAVSAATPAARAVAAAATAALRSSPLAPYDIGDHSGTWRQLVVRAARGGEVMVVAVVSEREAEGRGASGSQLLQAELARLAAALEDPAAVAAAGQAAAARLRDDVAAWAATAAGDGARALADAVTAHVQAACAEAEALGAGDVRVTSVHVVRYSGLSQPDPNAASERVSGRNALTERMCGLSFEISPQAFFQVNTPAAEVLYDTVARWAVRPDGLPTAWDGAMAAFRDLARDHEANLAERKQRGDPSAAARTWHDPADPAEEASPFGKRVEPPAAVLDVCCGTGTIGIRVAAMAAAGEGEGAAEGGDKPQFSRALGIELCAAAVADARRNAITNGIAGAHFAALPAEKVFAELSRRVAARGAGSSLLAGEEEDSCAAVDAMVAAIQGAGDGQCTAIVDPPRAGLHPTVLRALRTARAVGRIIYVSCNPTGSLIANTERLCAPPTNSNRGRPFYPVIAQPFDLFPDTPHCEMVLVLDRIGEDMVFYE